jgi:Ca2+-binding RTX toxin-like protein
MAVEPTEEDLEFLLLDLLTASLPSEDADDIVGTDDADTIDALGGNDTLQAGGGNDEAQGGDGHDHLSGGDGHDYLAGGEGNDLLEGDAGNDELYGEAGSDELHGGIGNDTLDGGLGHDELLGGDGHDELHGAEGNDRLEGGLGDDLIYGGAGDDELDGGDGWDTAIYAGSRAEYEITTDAHGVTQVRHKSGGTDGSDTLMSIEALQFADDVIAPPPHQPTPTGSLQELAADANGEYAIAGLGEVQLSTNFFSAEAGYNNVFGYYIADASGAPICGAVIETVARETSNDPAITIDLRAYSGASKLGFFVIANGGTRNPGLSDGQAVSFLKVNGTWAAYIQGVKLAGEGANVYFTNTALNADNFDHMTNTSGSGNQNWEDLKGGGDKDFDDLNVDIMVKALVELPAKIGDIQIQDSTPADGTLMASEGNPLTANIQLLIDPARISQIRYQWESSPDGQNWTALPGANRERFSPRQSEIGLSLRVALTYVLIDSVAQEIVSYSHATPAVMAAPPPANEGSAQDEPQNEGGSNGDGAGLPGGTQDNGHTPGHGEGGNGAGHQGPQPPANVHAIEGDDGANRLHGSRGADLIEAKGGHDIVKGAAGHDVIYGGDGNDVLHGGKGNDVIYGGGGDDWLSGGNGKDQLFGGDGNDKLMGGSGSDILDGGTGKDVLYGEKGSDKLYGGEGADQLYGGAGNDALSGGDDADKLVGGGGKDALAGGDGNDSLSGGAGADQLCGESGDDCLEGGSGNDKLYAGHGDDVLAGGAGHDQLYGGAGDDALAGGGGNDLLHGGKGDDALCGGAGRDTFVYSLGDGEDEILDFQEDCDALMVQADAATYTIAATDYGRDYVFVDGGKLAVHSNSGKGSRDSGSGKGSGKSDDGPERYESCFDDELDFSDFEGSESRSHEPDGGEWADLVACGVIEFPSHTAGVLENYHSPFADMAVDSLLGISMITFSHEDHNLFC